MERQLSHYTIISKIGEGGMGTVYRAIDTRLNRPVAIKMLRAPAGAWSDRQRRFVHEAQSASALNHPNIVGIYEFDSVGGEDFLAMEYVEGESLATLVREPSIPIARVVDYGLQIASALEAAHQAGIIHRDVKPANILVTRSGLVKVLDFGLAKLVATGPTAAYAPTEAAAPLTVAGVIVGTAAYMSPEQANGKPVGAPTDVFAVGAVLYEMLTGRRAFQGESPLSIMAAVVHDTPTPLREVRPDTPASLEHIVSRCLEKDPQKRYASAHELKADLETCKASLAGSTTTRRLTRPAVAALVVAMLLLAAAVTWLVARNARIRWARNVAVPEIESLVARGQSDAAFRLLRQVADVIPDDPQLGRLRNDVTDPVQLATDPPGAAVYTRGYLDVGDEWLPLGNSPLNNVLVPFGFRRWRLVKDGYETRETSSGPRVPVITLHTSADTPPGMVLVPGQGPSAVPPPAPLSDFWLDRYEVTNAQFKAFVDAGGYTNVAYWKQPFVKGAMAISWAEGMRLLRDATGRPGPSHWELSTYPEGQADLPVTGVSWYEAAAYAEYAGKSLPTYFHWRQAAAQGIFSDILLRSNFSGKGLAKVGQYDGLGAYGTFDMAGNAKEWCLNAAGTRRFILGGGWNEQSYMFTDIDAQDPFAREATYGFRCAKYSGALPASLSAPVENDARDYRKEQPVNNDTFKIFASLYAYDRTPLNATVEHLPDDSPYWRREKITIDAAYANERIPAHLFLPRNAVAPFQTVVFFPPGSAFAMRSSAYLDTRQIQFLVQSGRAVLYPEYRGSFDRWVDIRGTQELRDLTIQWSKDFSRCVDYLASRSDIDSARLGFYGISTGAVAAPLLLANDQRMKVAILLGGAFPVNREPPEVDPINFAPRVTVPVLMLNGRYDFVEPVETSQNPMFAFLGTAADRKRHVVYETGHAITTVQPMIKDVLDWLDTYLGPVRTSGS